MCSDSNRIKLIAEVASVFYNETESFHAPIGGDVAYILWAISTNDKVDNTFITTEATEILKKFDKNHDVWNYIKTVH